MRILISNDDGYFAPGIAVLAATLKTEGHAVTVVAPERDRSGASNSLTLDRPLMVRQTPTGFNYVNGTPTDCVHLAVTGLLPELPDMVISGINHGANMGDDTVYSGTVAAATEGFLLGIPSIAVSLANLQTENFQTAADFVAGLVRRFACTTVSRACPA
jgi:5'-nucleotidase